MEERFYEAMLRESNKHWWFLGRKKSFYNLISKLDLPKGSRILEIGAGAGANLEMLSSFGRVFACESDKKSYTHLRNVGWEVRYGKLPNDLPNFKFKFDLICLFDVLEHVEDDFSSIAKIKKLLAPNGFLIIACPAYQWLYDDYDRALGHFKRYTKKNLNFILQRNHFRIVESGYINTFLFPLIVLAKILSFIGMEIKKDLVQSPPSKFVNALFKHIFFIEARLTKNNLFPFGVTVISVSKLVKE
jgi:SAM-dependent methyltransferase